MKYLNNKTLELIIYLLFKGDLIEDPPSELFTQVFVSEIDDILADLRENNIDAFISFGKNKTTVKLIDKKSLEEFADEYIRNFEEDKLDKGLNNYYSFEKHMSVIPRFLLEPYFDKFRKAPFTISYNFNYVNLSLADENLKMDFSPEGYKNEIQKNLRLYELLLYLNNKKYITISNNFGFILYKKFPYLPRMRSTGGSRPLIIEDEYVLVINITFNKSPIEIYDINKYWLYYGDIRINETDGIGFYKQNRYPFQNTKSKAFKLLCYLLKHHGERISVFETYNFICSEDIEEEVKLTEYEKNKNLLKERKNKKDKIKGYIKEIKKNLKINEDENPSIFITMNDENVMLISNPPI